jgi:biopolymer transport protein TolR
MSFFSKRPSMDGQNQANITPLADVTTTLIVVFLITMPTIMWNGINVKPAEVGSEQQVIQHEVKDKNDLVTVKVDPDGIRLNGVLVDRADLEREFRAALSQREDHTVVVVPSDLVELGLVVEVLDAAKAGGASALALLNELGGGRG